MQQEYKPGDCFGKYTIIKRLGGGSFADVFRAKLLERSGGESECALKILRDPDAERALLRMDNEVFALKLIRHKRVPTLLDHGSDPSPHIAMTLARGETLRSLMVNLDDEFEWRSVVRIIEILLELLEFLQSKEIVHRDIKDDNIVVSPSLENLQLVDFGYCRAVGQPQDAFTWSRVGADLYSPPSKQEHPSQTNPRHDVFAVGVLAYYLLMKKYPWYVEGGDHGDLVALMRETEPTQLRSHRVDMPVNIATLFHDLIEIEDNKRPTASAAFTRLKEIEAGQISKDALGSVYQTIRPRCPRVFRDPLHGDIRLTEFEWKVMNTPEFQRLGYIRQLGTTHYVYRGATHSRMLHAIGSVFTVEKLMTSAEEIYGNPIEEDLRLQARLYALVHDITHISFGHTFEDELGIFKRHDSNDKRAARILRPSSRIASVLRENGYGKRVLESFDPASSEHRQELVHEMLASSTGADVLDYVDRDAFYCGLDDRIDSAIYRRFEISRSGGEADHLSVSLSGRHGVRIDAITALRTLFLARYSLYEKVYCHRVKIASGAMIGKALHLALEPKNGKRYLTEETVEKMVDDELLLRLQHSNRINVKQLADLVMTRQVYRTIFSSELCTKSIDIDHFRSQLSAWNIATPDGRYELEKTIAKKVKKITHNDVIVYVTPNPPGYGRLKQYFNPRDAAVGEADVSEAYSSIARQHLRLWKLYVFGSKKAQSVASAVAEVVEGHTGLTNDNPSVRKTQIRLFK